MHYCFGEWHGIGRTRVTSPGAAAAESAERGDPCGLSGAGDPWSRVAGRRKDVADIWARGHRESGDRRDGPVFRARWQERIDALATGTAFGAKANVSDARRTRGGAIATEGDPGPI